MSALKDRLTEDMKNAMRAHESLRLNTIRYMLSELKNFEIDNGEQDDAGVMKVIAREVKKLKDALVDFQNAGRKDLVDEETQKIAVMESYLPKQMSDEELMAKVRAAVEKVPSKNFGEVMKMIVADVQGQADGKRISEMVKQAMG